MISAIPSSSPLSPPEVDALGGVKRNTGTPGQFVTGVAADGSLLFDTPAGGAAPLTASVAFVRSAGDDGTGTIGDPTLPYLTMQAAYNAGARIFDLGAGNFAGISATGAITIAIQGKGRNNTTVTSVASTNGGAITIRDIGHQSAYIATINANGVSGTEGSPGSGGGSIVLEGCYVGTVSSFGGNGGSYDSGQGGAGGSGGSVTLNRCRAVGAISNSGGSGGTSSVDNGGVGGSAGTITMFFTECVAVNCAGGLGGDGEYSSFAGGDGGTAGNYEPYHSHCTGSVDISPGGGGAGASFGNTGEAGVLDGFHSSMIGDVSFNDGFSAPGTIDGHMLYIASVSGGTPNVTTVVSHINGTAY